ncbi:MAG: ABC transporter ATP-binding protein [Alphaproteobacteria bacterium]
MKPAIIEVTRTSKAFGGVAANREVTLHVQEGSITALIGPNGSGKTTLFNSIAGYHPIDSGSIRFEGREISRLGVQQIARLGLVRTFQQTRVFARMSCSDNMLIAAPHRGHGWRDMIGRHPRALVDKAGRLLEFVGLHAKRRLAAGSLSFGQQRLLEFAMALMNDPKLLLLDEPTAGINPTLINGLLDRLKSANRELGVTLFVIEHNMRVVMNLADRVYCMSRGEMLAEGPPARIQNDPRVIEAYLGRGSAAQQHGMVDESASAPAA